MTSFLGNVAALAATGQIGQLGMPPTPTLTRDPTWLQVEVCREYLRQACKRDNTECKYAHPSSNVDIQNGKVTVCFDAFKDRCTRSNCKYFHAPAQMKADLEMRGKMSLMRQKSEQLALQNQSSAAAAAVAAQLALLQHQLPTLVPPTHTQPPPPHHFLQNVPPGFPNSVAAAAAANTAIVQYHQLLQQQQQTYAAASAVNQATPVTVASPPINGLSPSGGINGGFFDPNHLALAAVCSQANGVVTPATANGGTTVPTAGGGAGGANLSSAGSSPSPPKVSSAMEEKFKTINNNTVTVNNNNENTLSVAPLTQQVTPGAACNNPPMLSPQTPAAVFTFQSPLSLQRMLQNNYVMKAAEKTHDNNSYVMQHPPSHNYVTLNNNNNYVMKASHESGAILPTGATNHPTFGTNYSNNANKQQLLVPRNAAENFIAAQAMNGCLKRGAESNLGGQNNSGATAPLLQQMNIPPSQSYANTSSLIPNYGKVLRLDSSGALNPSKLTPAATPVTPGTSPLGAALTHPFNPFTNGATGANGVSPHGAPPASPQAAHPGTFFYTTSPMYAAHLAAAASNQSAAAAAAALLPSTNSPAFLTSPGATLMNGSPSSAALFANTGRYAAF